MPKADEVAAAWDRIVGWLQRHAPASAEALGPGASDAEVARLNESLGFGIPDVLEVWLRMNNGSTAKDSEKPIPGGGTARLPHRDSIIFPDGMRFLGCKEIAGRHAEYLHIARDIGDGDYWKTPWIPVMETSDGPYGILLDTQDSSGSPSLLSFSEGDYPSSCLPSLGAYLQPLADLLESDGAPSVTEGRICWPD